MPFITHVVTAIFFPRVILYTFSHFCSFSVVWGLGLGYWGWGSQLIGFGACGGGPSGFFYGWGSLYKHRIITLGKTPCVFTGRVRQ